MYAKLAGGVFALAAIFLALYGAYHHGVITDKARSDLVISKLATTSATQHANDLQAARDAEQQHANDLAALDAKYQSEQANAKINSDRTIADLIAGNIGLRNVIAGIDGKSASVPSAGASASGGYAAGSAELRPAGAAEIIADADAADAVVRQLTACQAVVRDDRR